VAEEEERRQQRQREREKEREREAEEKARKMRKEYEATYRQASQVARCCCSGKWWRVGIRWEASGLVLPLLQLERKVDDKDHQRLKDIRREDEKRAARLRDRVRGGMPGRPAFCWRGLIYPTRLSQEKETRKLLDFFSKYDDDADDSKYYSSSQVRWDGQRDWRALVM
jgi:hypothetical protein